MPDRLGHSILVFRICVVVLGSITTGLLRTSFEGDDGVGIRPHVRDLGFDGGFIDEWQQSGLPPNSFDRVSVSEDANNTSA